MSVFEALHITTIDESRRVKKAADTPIWLWEDGAMTGGLLFVALVGGLAAGMDRFIMWAIFACVCIVWLLALNLHELALVLAHKHYQRQGRIVCIEMPLARYVRDGLVVGKHEDSVSVCNETFLQLKEICKDFGPDQARALDLYDRDGDLYSQMLASYQWRIKQALRPERSRRHVERGRLDEQAHKLKLGFIERRRRA